MQDQFPQFVCEFMRAYHPDGKIPAWIIEALATVGINLKPATSVEADQVAGALAAASLSTSS